MVRLRTRAVELDGKRGVVVEGGTTAWVPSDDVLLRLEQAFTSKLGETADRGRRVDGYFRQYWGRVEGSKRLVDVELFQEPPAGIKHQPTIVFDGGPGHASTTYDPERETFSGLVGGP